MRKITFTLLFLAVLVSFNCGIAQATSLGPYFVTPNVQLLNTNDSTDYVYTFTIGELTSYDPLVYTFTWDDISLAVTMKDLDYDVKTTGSKPYSYTDSATVKGNDNLLGSLTLTSPHNNLWTNAFDLSSILDSIINNAGQLTVKIRETTTVTGTVPPGLDDGGQLTRVELFGHYTLTEIPQDDDGDDDEPSTVPEPASLSLLGLGLVGLGLMGRKRKT